MMEQYGLIVEDDTDLVTIFSQALMNAGYKTDTCQSGTEALVKLDQVVPQIVVLDLHLPELSGVDVLNWIQADRRFASTHVIVATADPLLADTLRDKIDLVLIKPVSYRQLNEMAGRFRNAQIS